jgi:hypothetical protein
MTCNICPCGIARADCDYHKPEKQEVTTFKVETMVDYIYQGNGIWTKSTNPSAPLNTGALVVKRSINDNPFLTNDMAARGKYIVDHPNTWQDAMKAAGLSYCSELRPS